MKAFSLSCFPPFWDNHNCKLEQNLHYLKDAVKLLNNKKEDIKIRVKREESSYKGPTFRVTDWLYKADWLEVEIEKVIAQVQEELLSKVPGCCFANCFCSNSEVGRRVWEKLNAVNQLISEGNFDVVVKRTPHDFVDLINIEPTVNFESGLDDVWRCVDDNNLGIVGIYGMAGVGKTTLLKKIKNELLIRRRDFETVIWFSASKEANVNAFQNVIRKGLNISNETWRNTNKSSLLGSRKFILLLDDADRMDLSKLGFLLSNESGNKVIFTTRSESVCDGMKVQIKLKLKCLSHQEAIKLFLVKLGADHSNNTVDNHYLGDTINAEFCQGLPLALVAVGQAMAKISNRKLWENAITTLQSYPSMLPGMDYIFRIIEPSLESLEDGILKDCFIYSCILPNLITKDELIKLWIGEGILDMHSKNLGDYIIKRLKASGLLEDDELCDIFSMHAVIRAFGLWLAHEHGKRENKFLIQERRVEKWTEAVRISIYDQNVDLLFPLSPCPQLRSLLIRNTEITALPMEWPSMNALGALDLSRNKRLSELPRSIGSLVNLQYLNLSFTNIKELFVEMKNLKNLKILLMDHTRKLQIIPKRLISGFTTLQVFNKFGNDVFDDTTVLEELESIDHMSEMSISLISYLAASRLLNSIRLQSWIRNLWIRQVEKLKIPISVLSRMVLLEDLVIEDCEDLTFENDNTQYYVLTLRSLRLLGCSNIHDLQWLIFAPRVQSLYLQHCGSLLEILGGDFKSEEIKELDERLGIWSNLQKLYLEDLQDLCHICPQDLNFPNLLEIGVVDCPNLLELPFHSHSARRLRGIKGSQSWWDNLIWDDVDIKEVFNLKFQDVSGAGPFQETDILGNTSTSMVRQQELMPLSIESSTTVGHEASPPLSGSHTDVTPSKGKGKEETSILKSAVGIRRKLVQDRKSEIASSNTKRKWALKSPMGIKRKSKSEPSADFAPSNTKEKLALESLIGNKRLESTWTKPFTYKELVEATSNFADFYRIGMGGFGIVYKGVLSSGEVIAVKMYRKSDGSMDKEFWTEIRTLSRIHHRNIVKLLGFSQYKDNKFLVYEFLPNNGLDAHLHGDKNSTINWSTRMKISLGTAKGLAYLHEDCKPRIIHRNIKAKSILLDSNFEPKISGFMLALSLQDYESAIEESDVAGTFGYLDPEYVRSGRISIKADVFSFGVVLLELITGQKAISISAKGYENIVTWVKPLLKGGLKSDNHDAFIDPKLEHHYVEDEIYRMICCAAACVYKPGNLRPQMSQIVEVLKGNSPLERVWQLEDDFFLQDDNEPSSPRGRDEITEVEVPSSPGGRDEITEVQEYLR